MEPETLPIVIIVNGRRWFQRTFGNTYHSASIRCVYADKTEKNIGVGCRYGYGDAYMESALTALIDAGVIRETMDHKHGLWRLCESFGIILDYSCADVSRKSEL